MKCLLATRVTRASVCPSGRGEQPEVALNGAHSCFRPKAAPWLALIKFHLVAATDNKLGWGGPSPESTVHKAPGRVLGSYQSFILFGEPFLTSVVGVLSGPGTSASQVSNFYPFSTPITRFSLKKSSLKVGQLCIMLGSHVWICGRQLILMISSNVTRTDFNTSKDIHSLCWNQSGLASLGALVKKKIKEIKIKAPNICNSSSNLANRSA